MKDATVKLPSGAHGRVLTEPDDNGMVDVIVSNSARIVTIHKDKLVSR